MENNIGNGDSAQMLVPITKQYDAELELIRDRLFAEKAKIQKAEQEIEQEKQDLERVWIEINSIKEFLATKRSKLSIVNEYLDLENWVRLFKLSQQRKWLAIIISLILWPLGYVYTRRWKALLRLMLGIVGVYTLLLFATASGIREAGNSSLETFVWFGCALISAVDNSAAIQYARERVRDWNE